MKTKEESQKGFVLFKPRQWGVDIYDKKKPQQEQIQASSQQTW